MLSKCSGTAVKDISGTHIAVTPSTFHMKKNRPNSMLVVPLLVTILVESKSASFLPKISIIVGARLQFLGFVQFSYSLIH